MGDDEESNKLHSYSWPELLKRPRRELLVNDLLFTTGVTTLVAPSGDGKTTLALSISLTVATGGIWNGQIIKPRPVVWVAGEGQDDLRPMYEAWLKEHPNYQAPQGCFLEEPIDLSSGSETDKLIKLLEGMPPALIVTDALADMIGDLSEDKSKDMNQVYRNIWRVGRNNNGSFLIPHHAGWNTERERGSTGIRAKNDIVAQIVDFDPAAGFIKLKHNKRRGGAKLKEFAYEVKLITVAGYPQPIPIVTGVNKTTADIILNQPIEEAEGHARELVRIMLEDFPDGATNAQFQKKSGMTASTFNRARGWAKGAGWLVGGGGRGVRYKLNPDESWKVAISSPALSLPSLPSLHPYRGVEVNESDRAKGIASMEVSWNQVGSDSDRPPKSEKPSETGTDPVEKASELLKKAGKS
jgi:hypothetical protein